MMNLQEEMHKYTEIVWNEEVEVKIIQKKLNSPFKENGIKINLEDVIIRKWKTVLED